MTVAVALILLGALLLYAGIKGKSLKSALIGKSVAAPSGSLLQKSGS
jgi:hypothetical protein